MRNDYWEIGVSPKNLEESGFSLLEMLIALAVTSLTSLALFQSIGTMLNVSDRAVSVGERTLEEGITRRATSELIDGLVAQWGEGLEESFSGTPEVFSGYSSQAIHSITHENAPFKLSLRSVEAGKMLIYETKTEDWVLETGLPDSAYFEYLGRESKWHKYWPAREQPFLEPRDQLSQLIILKLPQAIRVSTASGANQHLYLVGRHRVLPYKLELTVE